MSEVKGRYGALQQAPRRPWVFFRNFQQPTTINGPSLLLAVLWANQDVCVCCNKQLPSPPSGSGGPPSSWRRTMATGGEAQQNRQRRPVLYSHLSIAVAPVAMRQRWQTATMALPQRPSSSPARVYCSSCCNETEPATPPPTAIIHSCPFVLKASCDSWWMVPRGAHAPFTSM